MVEKFLQTPFKLTNSVICDKSDLEPVTCIQCYWMYHVDNDLTHWNISSIIAQHTFTSSTHISINILLHLNIGPIPRKENTIWKKKSKFTKKKQNRNKLKIQQRIEIKPKLKKSSKILDLRVQNGLKYHKFCHCLGYLRYRSTVICQRINLLFQMIVFFHRIVVSMREWPFATNVFLFFLGWLCRNVPKAINFR